MISAVRRALVSISVLPNLNLDPTPFQEFVTLVLKCINVAKEEQIKLTLLALKDAKVLIL